MNWLNFFTKLYSKERNIPGLPFWVMTPVRRLTKYAANKVLPHYLASSRPDVGGEHVPIIVSFTSFPARINNVWKVVKSLKGQSIRPEKIILWLSKEQFHHREDVPESLWKEVDDLFEIRMVEGDIRSHKKFYYVMQEYPDTTFVTCDDDIYYDPDFLKYLVDASRQFPGCVIANKTRQIGFAEDGTLKPYNEWKDEQTAFEAENLIQIGVGGVLYPPKALHELTLRKDLFFTLTPMADDVWLNCMARLNGTPIVQSAMKMKPLAIKSNAPTLKQQNRGHNGNDEQLSKLMKYLKEEGLSDVYSLGYRITLPQAVQ